MIKTMSPFTNLCHFVEYKLILKTFIEFDIFLTIIGLFIRRRCRYIYILVTWDSLHFFIFSFFIFSLPANLKCFLVFRSSEPDPVR